MSLGRLLTSGKSLVGLHNTEGRYEMRSKNLLPKFGSNKNPFLTAKPQSLQSEFSRKLPAAPPTLTHAEVEAAKLKETKRLPELIANKPEVQTVTRPTMKMKVWSWIKKLKPFNPLAWLAARRLAKSAAQPVGKAPVQAELSLEKIKVVRNDLSEADLEVVPVKISVKPKSEPPVQSSAKAGETAELLKV